MFERLAGKLLTRLLSKYFTQPSSSSSPPTSTGADDAATDDCCNPQLGVWSGYVSLDNLLLKNEVIDEFFSSRGLPFELLHCSLGRVEITVPWAKLGRSRASNGGDGEDEAAVVVVVDGLHALLSTKYYFDDEAVERSRVEKRRKALDDFLQSLVRDVAESDEDTDDGEASSSSSFFAGFFRNLAKGAIVDVLGKVHVHLRNVHVRLEDVRTDPSNPFACGITLESLHVQNNSGAEQEGGNSDGSFVAGGSYSRNARYNMSNEKNDGGETGGGVIRKLMQLNHFGVYCNSIVDKDTAPWPLSVLQKLLGDQAALSRAMHSCIGRRAQGGADTGGGPSRGIKSPAATDGDAAAQPPPPLHCYLLVPVDVTCHVRLSSDPWGALRRWGGLPALEASVRVGALAVEFRDHQYEQLVGLAASVRYHLRVQNYRRYRPKVSVFEDPRGWWRYAFEAVRVELRDHRGGGGGDRWSWHRLRTRSNVGRRYCSLYRRSIVAGIDDSSSGPAVSTDDVRNGHLEEGRKANVEQLMQQPHSKAAVPPTAVATTTPESSLRPLTAAEARELSDIEDGIRGDLTVHDVIVFRAIVNAGLSDEARGRLVPTTTGSGKTTTSGLSSFIRGVIREDVDAEEEYERALRLIERRLKEQRDASSSSVQGGGETSVAVSLELNLERGSFSLFSSDETKSGHYYYHQQFISTGDGCFPKYRRFLEVSFESILASYLLYGQFDSFLVNVSMGCLEGYEVRASGQRARLFSSNLRSHVSTPVDERSMRRGVSATPEPNSHTLSIPSPGRSAKRLNDNVDPVCDDNDDDDTGPLFRLTFEAKPVRTPQFDVAITGRLQQIEAVISPRSEWPLRIDSFFASRPSMPDAEGYWEDLKFAFINSWKSAKAELQAKAELAVFKHKNVDLNLFIRAPLLIIRDSKSARLIVDLGRVRIITHRLAGVSGKLHVGDDGDPCDNEQNGQAKPLPGQGLVTCNTDSSVSEVIPVDQNALSPEQTDGILRAASGESSYALGSQKWPGGEDGTAWTRRPSHQLDSLSLGPLAMSLRSLSSVDGAKTLQRMRGISFATDDSAIAGNTITKMKRRSKGTSNLMQACFYDVFHVKIWSIRVVLSRMHLDTYSNDEIIRGLESTITVEKSVIPSDHTLSKIKVDGAIGGIFVTVSQSNVGHLLELMRSWQTAKNAPPLNDTPERAGDLSENRRLTIGSIVNSHLDSHQMTETVDDRDSINEDEFLDAREFEAEADDGTGTWFDESWVSGGERRSRGKSRRLARTNSDVSSMSGGDSNRHSTRTSSRRGENPYLNAENLAKLDEKDVEDDVRSESELSQISTDTFHSAMSLNDQVELLSALQGEICAAEDEIERLKADINKVSKSPKTKGCNGDPRADRGKNRMSKKEMQLLIIRSEAEVRALRAAYHDLMAQISFAKQHGYENLLDQNGSNETAASNGVANGHDDTGSTNGKDGVTVLPEVDEEVTLRVKALLRSRAKRSNVLDTPHTLTKRLNRDIFFGCIVVEMVVCELSLAEDEQQRPKPDSLSRRAVLFTASTLAGSIHHRTLDTRLSASIQSFYISNEVRTFDGSFSTSLLKGGLDSSLDANETPQCTNRKLFVDTPNEDAMSKFQEKQKIVKVAGAIVRHPSSGGNANTQRRNTRFKVAVGSVEFCLAPDTLRELWPLSQLLHPSEGVPAGKPREDFRTSPYMIPEKPIDFSIKIDSVKCKLVENRRDICALCFSGTELRLIRTLSSSSTSKNRGQLDVRVHNVQLIDFSDESGDTLVKELLGRHDANTWHRVEPLVHVRLRTQQVPSNQAGGWVVDGEVPSTCQNGNKGDNLWNFHVGVTIRAPSVLGDADSFQSVLKRTRSILDLTHGSLDGSENPVPEVGTDEASIPCPLTIRWRADFAVEDFRCVVPCGSGNLDRVGGSQASFCFGGDSFHVSAQPDDLLRDKLRVVVSTIGVRLTLTDMNSNVIKPISWNCNILVPLPQELAFFVADGINQIELPTNSRWLQYSYDGGGGSGHRDASHTEDVPDILVVLATSPIRIHLSSRTIILLEAAASRAAKVKASHDLHERPNSNQADGGVYTEGMEQGGTAKLSRKLTPREQTKQAPMSESRHAKFLLGINFPLLGVDFETGEGSNVPTESIMYLSVHGASINACFFHSPVSGLVLAKSSLAINNLSVHDLSCRPGIRVLGFQAFDKSTATERQNIASFSAGKEEDSTAQILVRWSLKPLGSGGASSNLLLDFDFGSCQCLVLPSFLENTLKFVGRLAEINGQDQKDTNENTKTIHGSSFIDKISFPFGTRSVHLSIRSSGFEVILAAKDMAALMSKSGVIEVPINVVSFRWTGSCLKVKGSLSGEGDLQSVQEQRSKTLLGVDIIDNDASACAKQIMESWTSHQEFVKNSIHAELTREVASQCPLLLRRFFVLKTECRIQDFQVLRTCVLQVYDSSNISDILPGHRGDVALCAFAIDAPAAGEQIIVSPFSFQVCHSLVATSFDNRHLCHSSRVAASVATGREESTEDEQNGTENTLDAHHLYDVKDHTHVSQSIELNVGFVDILVYARQSSEGMNEALKTTFRPFMERAEQGHEQQSNVEDENNWKDSSGPSRDRLYAATPKKWGTGIRGGPTMRPVASEVMPASYLDTSEQYLIPEAQHALLTNEGESHTFLEALHHSISVFSFHLERMQVTVVPGGATRLTEAPIMKAAIAGFQGGLAITPVKKEVDRSLMSTSAHESGLRSIFSLEPSKTKQTFEAMVSSNDTNPCTSVLQMAGWVTSDISAHYQNRRVVDWEPFVEPWTVRMELGIDLTRALKLPTSPWRSSPLRSIQSTELSSSLAVLFDIPHNSSIRDIGRRLLSLPGTSGSPPTEQMTVSKEESAPVFSELLCDASDLSHLMLYLICPKCMDMALNKAANFPSDMDASVHLGTYGTGPFLTGGGEEQKWRWLHRHGFPSALVSSYDDGADRDPVFAVSFSDTKRPLNINITGALMENVLDFVSNGPQQRRNMENNLPLAPHLIKNECGVPIRFTEDLEPERQRKGEKGRPTTLASGTEAALSLKRSLSQTCDPHRAYIIVDVGSSDASGSEGFGEGRVFYRAFGRIPVDMVGVYEYVLYHVDNEAKSGAGHEKTLQPGSDNVAGMVVARVTLAGGTKIVSIESPVMLKNICELPLCCQLIDRENVLWKATLPKRAKSMAEHENGSLVPRHPGNCVPVPCDLIWLENCGSVKFLVSAIDDAEHGEAQSVTVPLPRPLSEKSAKRGIIGESNCVLETYRKSSPSFHMCLCSLRIGDFNPQKQMERLMSGPFAYRPQAVIPEQRMLLFRPQYSFRNHLPMPIILQIRRKPPRSLLERSTSYSTRGRPNNSDKKSSRRPSSRIVEWEECGLVLPGASVTWTGAYSSDSVEIRCRLMLDNQGEESLQQFPTWSTGMLIPSELDLVSSTSGNTSAEVLASKMTLKDSCGVPLSLSIAIERKGLVVGDSDSILMDNVRKFSNMVPEASKVVAIFVPYWVVDTSNMCLEYTTNAEASLAGQRCIEEDEMHDGILGKDSSYLDNSRKDDRYLRSGLSGGQGLSSLLLDEGFAHLCKHPEFDIYMIGDDQANKLCARVRVRYPDQSESTLPAWSDPISIRTVRGARKEQNFSVKPYSHEPGTGPQVSSSSSFPNQLVPLALSARTVPAPDSMGGTLGTKLIHVVDRYVLVNLTGREIEIAPSERAVMDDNFVTPATAVTLSADGRPTPFHIDDKRPVRFRPRDYGWNWSGPIHVKGKRPREITMRLENTLTGSACISTIVISRSSKSPQTNIILRRAVRPPFRLENHTLHPLTFVQEGTHSKHAGGSEYTQTSCSVILPYHSVNYAWKNPEKKWRILTIDVARMGLEQSHRHSKEETVIGRYELDQLVPGALLEVWNDLFRCEVVADGPTRVLRITDSSLPMVPDEDQKQDRKSLCSNHGVSSPFPLRLELKLLHGIGISVVDFAPRELIYLRFEDMTLERRFVSGTELVKLDVGYISADNQLWLTPYPVLLRMGSFKRATTNLRRRRRKQAIRVSWCRERNCPGGNDGLTLVPSVELATEPLNLMVDGILIDRLREMLNEVKGAGINNSGEKHDDGGMDEKDRRDYELGKVLGLDLDYRFSGSGKPVNESLVKVFEHAFGDNGLVVTTMMALKSIHNQGLDGQRVHASYSSPEALARTTTTSMSGKSQPLSRTLHKYYIEKLRISPLTVFVSWTGPLPAFFTLPDFMRPALTFEGLPLTFRGYSSSHAYGTTREHVDILRGHYLSMRRIVDLLVGLAFKPLFMSHAFVVTTRQVTASQFERMSKVCASYAASLYGWYGALSRTERIDPWQPKPILGTEATKSSNQSHHRTTKEIAAFALGNVYQQLAFHVVKLSAGFLRGSASMTSMISSVLTYGGNNVANIGQSGRRRNMLNATRSRPPRLFANLDGKDLLVDYEEGANAGKALLSRVKMGSYLGEGYVWHASCSYDKVNTSKNWQARNGSQSQTIIMMTSERLLLLSVEMSMNFCVVLWDALYDSLIEVEACAGFRNDPKDDSTGDSVRVWYVSTGSRANERKDPTSERLLQSSDQYAGLNSLEFKELQMSTSDTARFAEELFKIRPHLRSADLVGTLP